MTAMNPGAARPEVTVLGTGIMGSAMARNLVAAGLETTVWDGSAAATSPLADAGAVVAPSAAEAVAGAQAVITTLPTAEVVKSVMFSRGVADALPEGCVWAQMGTIGVAETLGIRDQLAAGPPGVLFVDAPVSGSKGPAEQAEMCQHQPQCPEALAPDHQAARAVATHPEQGWSLLCNGVVLFDDAGELLPDGRAVAPAPMCLAAA